MGYGPERELVFAARAILTSPRCRRRRSWISTASGDAVLSRVAIRVKVVRLVRQSIPRGRARFLRKRDESPRREHGRERVDDEVTQHRVLSPREVHRDERRNSEAAGREDPLRVNKCRASFFFLPSRLRFRPTRANLHSIVFHRQNTIRVGMYMHTRLHTVLHRVYARRIVTSRRVSPACSWRERYGTESVSSSVFRARTRRERGTT